MAVICATSRYTDIQVNTIFRIDVFPGVTYDKHRCISNIRLSMYLTGRRSKMGVFVKKSNDYDKVNAQTEPSHKTYLFIKKSEHAC